MPKQRRQRNTAGPPSGGRRGAVEASESGKAIALYHVVYAHETFEDAAQAVFEMVQHAQREFPGRPRGLYLDIDGHRNSKGGFDAGMRELQQDYILGFLMPYLTEVAMPLGRYKRKSGTGQRDDLPDVLQIQPKDEPAV